MRHRAQNRGQPFEPRSPWAGILPNEEQLAELYERGCRGGLSDEEIERRIAEGLERALERAGEHATEILYVEIRKRRHAALRRDRRARRSFERRLRRRTWGKALDLFALTYAACLEAGSSFNAQHREAAVADQDARFEALCRVHARACTTASEVYALLRTGHGHGALARWRTMYELSVTSALLGANDAELSRRFLAHVAVDEARDARTYQDYCNELDYEPFTDDEMRELQTARADACEEFGGRFGEDWGWAETIMSEGARPTFKTLAEKARLDHLRPFYRWSTHGTHAGAKGAAMNLLELPDGSHVLLGGASDEGLADPANLTLRSLLQVTVTLLLHGRDADGIEPMTAPIIGVLSRMVDEGEQAFGEAHGRLELRASKS